MGVTVEPFLDFEAPAFSPPRSSTASAAPAFNANSLLDSFISMRRGGDTIAAVGGTASTSRSSAQTLRELPESSVENGGNKRKQSTSAYTIAEVLSKSPPSRHDSMVSASKRAAVDLNPGQMSSLPAAIPKQAVSKHASRDRRRETISPPTNAVTTKPSILCSRLCAAGNRFPRMLQVRIARLGPVVPDPSLPLPNVL